MTKDYSISVHLEVDEDSEKKVVDTIAIIYEKLQEVKLLAEDLTTMLDGIVNVSV